MMFQNEKYLSDIEEAPYKFAQPGGSTAGGLTPSQGGGGDQVIQIGTGQKSFNVDFSGMWIGSARFVNAPFSVDMLGNAVIRALKEGTTIILDEHGLESTNNFPFVQQTKTDDQTFAGTTWQDVLGLTIAYNDLLRPVNTLLFASLTGYHQDINERLEFRFMVNNAQAGPIFGITQASASPVLQTVNESVVATMSLEDNLIIIQARSSNSNSGFIKGTVNPSYFHSLLLGR